MKQIKEKILRIIKSKILKLVIKYSYFTSILIILIIILEKLREINEKLFFIFQYVYNMYLTLLSIIYSTQTYL
jgi:hypothetical protein